MTFLKSGKPERVQLKIFATVLEVGARTELSLRRLSEIATAGDTIGAHLDDAETVGRLVDGATVADVRGLVSPMALPFDIDSAPALAADAPDELPGHWGSGLWWLTDGRRG